MARQRTRMKRQLTHGLLCSQLVALLLTTSMMPATFAQTSTAQGSASKNLLGDAAQAIGAKKCQAALARLGNIATYGSQRQDILVDWDKQKPDSNPVFSMLGASYPNGAVAASVVAVPSADGKGCSVLAERISVAPFTCDSIAQAELANYRVTSLLPQFNVYTDPNDSNSTVSLMSSPPGCLIIRRYVKFHWTEPKS